MPNFTYINNVPAASHNPSVDQPDMQINTNSIDGIIAVDHYGFNDDDGGYHKVIHQPQIPSNTDPTTISGTGQTYVKTNNSEQKLYYKSGSGNVYGCNSYVFNGVFPLIDNTAKPVFQVPDDCIGFVIFNSNGGTLIPYLSQSFTFACIAGNLIVQYGNGANSTTPASVPLLASATNSPPIFYISVLGSSFRTNVIYKYVYWPY